MRVMGIDPGLTRTGFGVVQSDGSTLRALAVGTVRAPKDEPPPTQLLNLCLELERVMEKFQPEAVAIEKVFFNSNVKTAIRVGQASGVALLAAAEIGIEVFEYTPTEVKAAVVGVGNASKDQVGYMVGKLLRLNEEPDSPDAADALALAICHANGHKMRGIAKRAQRPARPRLTVVKAEDK